MWVNGLMENKMVWELLATSKEKRNRGNGRMVKSLGGCEFQKFRIQILTFTLKLSINLNINFLNSMRTQKPPQKQQRKARSELTEEQKQEIKEAFDLFDTDGTGYIDVKGITNLIIFRIEGGYESPWF